eukprot:SAG31_NODE_1550_length_7909_cov_4.107554_1_plen_376_part_00
MAHHARSAEPAEHHVGESSDTVVDVAAMGDMSADPCSYANVLALRQTGLHMELVVDFEKKTLAGTATLSLAVLDPACEVCTLDTRDLTIRKVVSAAAPDVPLTFEYGDTSEALGAQLKIFLPAPAGGSHKLLLSYETSPESMAIGWLPPEQTAGKAHPYMFTQCQAIHARGLVPCQDSPGVKCPYTATLSVPGELTALMSAVRSAEPKAADDDSGRTIFSFSQPVPTSSYLIAIACGNLTAIRVGPRTQVWSEPEMVEAGAFEFADTEQFVAIGEQICGPYEWGVYDILLLPPSFPCACPCARGSAMNRCPLIHGFAVNRWRHGEPLLDLRYADIVSWRQISGYCHRARGDALLDGQFGVARELEPLLAERGTQA